MSDRDDPILDACLLEVLGSKSPPNLTDRILQAWSAQQKSASLADGAASIAPPVEIFPSRPLPVWQQVAGTVEPQAPPVQYPAPQPPPIELPTRHTSANWPTAASPLSARKKSSSALSLLIVVAGLLLLAVGVGIALRGNPAGAGLRNQVAQQSPTNPNQLAERKNGGVGANSSKNKTRVAPEGVAKSADRATKSSDLTTPNGVAGSSTSSKNASSPNKATSIAKNAAGSSPDELRNKSPSAPSADSLSKDNASFGERAVAKRPALSGSHLSASTRQTSSAERDVIAFIDEALRTAWKEQGIAPSGTATDAEWCRRTFLRLIGRIPTVEELNRFVDDRSSQKRQILVDQLVNGSSYADEYAANWASIWSNVLIGRKTGGNEESQRVRAGLQQYLRQAFHQNKPYNELAYDLISATGSNHSGDADYNGAVNFLLANQSEKATLATTRVARVFLGSQLHCAQCHVHPSSDSNQAQFWQLNAFFRQMHVERDKNSGAVRVVNRDFSGEQSGSSDGALFFELRDGKVRVAYPVFIDGTALPKSGAVEEVNRRQELAKLVAQSENLSRAVVNRVWAHFLGYGFTQPIDDISEENKPSHPELMQRLSHEFAANGYDLKRLMKWLTMSEAFGLSSKISNQNIADMPNAGTRPLFSHYYTRQMQAEELFQSLQLLANSRKSGGTPGDREKAKQAFLGQVIRNGVSDEGSEDNLHGAPQPLLILKGDLTRRALLPSHETMLGKVAESKLSPEAKIEHLFLAALSRKPTKRELTSAKEVLAASDESSVTGLQDLWWALLNSNEFILDH